MKKRRVMVEEYKNQMGIYTITINNARYCKNCINKILKSYLKDKTIFLGLYRIDGVDLSAKAMKELKTKIPLFFQKYGDVQNLNEHLTIANICLNDTSYDFFSDIFDYYLDTIVFNPKIDWKTFKQYYSNYQEHRLEDMILNHLAEVLFCYSDSGDFSICFSSEFYSCTNIKNMISKVLLEEGFSEATIK